MRYKVTFFTDRQALEAEPLAQLVKLGQSGLGQKAAILARFSKGGHDEQHAGFAVGLQVEAGHEVVAP